MKSSAISTAFQISCGYLVERWNYARGLTPNCAMRRTAAINFRGHGDAAQIDGVNIPRQTGMARMRVLRKLIPLRRLIQRLLVFPGETQTGSERRIAREV
jgi:hypothetical protein